MAGLLPLKSSFAGRRLHLGYREARLVGDGPLGPSGTLYRGHEFHYATATDEGEGEPLFEARDSRGEALGRVGRRKGKVCGSFLHLIDLAESVVAGSMTALRARLESRPGVAPTLTPAEAVRAERDRQ
jgi:cobyrinic acid a,c-diamide synthase